MHTTAAVLLVFLDPQDSNCRLHPPGQLFSPLTKWLHTGSKTSPESGVAPDGDNGSVEHLPNKTHFSIKG